MHMRQKRSTRLECEALEDRVTPATLTWTGVVDGLWSHAGNWSTSDVTHPVPQNGDAIVLPSAAANLTQTDDLGSLSLTSITLQDFGYSISGDPITLGNLSAAQALGTMGSDTIANNVVFDVSAQNATIDLGVAMVNLTLAGPVVVSGGGTLTIISGQGGIDGGNGTLSVSGPMTVQQSATVDVQYTDVALLGDTGVYGTLIVGVLSGPAGRVDIAPGATLDDAGTVRVQEGGELFVAGLAVVDSQATWTVKGGSLLLIETGGSLYTQGVVQVTNQAEVYDAGLIVVENGGGVAPFENAKFVLSDSNTFLVVPAGGQLYAAGLIESDAGGQMFAYGTVQIASGGGLYLYDSVMTVEQGGALYAYGTVAIEPDSALYDYGVTVLESSGYLYDADLFVVEHGGVFYDYGTFNNAGTYYNFGQQIGG